MKVCQNCGTQNDDQNKFCAQCAAPIGAAQSVSQNQQVNSVSPGIPPKKKKSIFARWWFWVIIVIVLIVIVSSGNKNSSSTTVSQSSAPSSSAKAAIASPSPTQTTYKVGDVITTAKFEITITSVEEKSQVGGNYLSSKPSEGGTYVCVTWKYKNISDKPISSFSCPTINILDKANTKYKSDISASSYFATESKLDTKILSDLNPGITVNGAAVFEIAKVAYSASGWSVAINADKNLTVSIK